MHANSLEGRHQPGRQHLIDNPEEPPIILKTRWACTWPAKPEDLGAGWREKIVEGQQTQKTLQSDSVTKIWNISLSGLISEQSKALIIRLHLTLTLALALASDVTNYSRWSFFSLAVAQLHFLLLVEWREINHRCSNWNIGAHKDWQLQIIEARG